MFAGNRSLSCDFVSFKRIDGGRLEVHGLNRGTRVGHRVLIKGTDYEVDEGWIQIATLF